MAPLLIKFSFQWSAPRVKLPLQQATLSFRYREEHMTGKIQPLNWFDLLTFFDSFVQIYEENDSFNAIIEEHCCYVLSFWNKANLEVK